MIVNGWMIHLCPTYGVMYHLFVIFFEYLSKSIAMDTDFLIDIVYHRVKGHYRWTFQNMNYLVYENV